MQIDTRGRAHYRGDLRDPICGLLGRVMGPDRFGQQQTVAEIEYDQETDTTTAIFMITRDDDMEMIDTNFMGMLRTTKYDAEREQRVRP